MKSEVAYLKKSLGKLPKKNLTDWYNDLMGTQARNVELLDETDDQIVLNITDVPKIRLKSTKGYVRIIKTYSVMNRPSKNVVEKIASRFSSPDEFISQYNAYLMSRLKDKDLVEWFNNMPESDLDDANDYYLRNERIKRFNTELRMIKRKCKTAKQMIAFNKMLESFCESKSLVKSFSEPNYVIVNSDTNELIFGPESIKVVNNKLKELSKSNDKLKILSQIDFKNGINSNK